MLRQSFDTSSQKDINNMHTPDAIAYPRTGKRGVPQQFPRRLYTMLQSETSDRTIVENNEIPLIQWSKSGQAFHISDIDLFSSHVLPKYFRTSKFSSFQRNLNLVSKHIIVHWMASRSAFKASYWVLLTSEHRPIESAR